MLTSKQRATLRAMANDIEAIFQIGKDGITPNLTVGVDEALEKRELVKIRILETAGIDTREACDTLAGRTRSEPVQCIGRRFVLYRPSKTNKTIDLSTR